MKRMHSCASRLILFLTLLVGSLSAQGNYLLCGPDLAEWEVRYEPRRLTAEETLARISETNQGWQRRECLREPEGWNGLDELWVRTKVEKARNFSKPVLFMTGVNQYVAVFQKGKTLAVSGRLDSTGSPEFVGYPLVFLPLAAADPDQPIYLQFLSDHRRIGTIGGIEVTERELVTERVIRADLFSVVVGALCLVIGIFMFLFFLSNRKDRVALGYAIFAASIGVFIALRTDLTKTLGVDAKILFTVEALALFFAPFGCASYLQHAFSELVADRSVKWAGRIILGYTALAAVLVLFAGVPIQKTIFPLQILIIASIAVGAVLLARLLVRKNVDAIIVTVGFLIFFVASVFDVVASMFSAFGYLRLTSLGAAAAVTAFGLVILRRYRQMQREIVCYTKELEDKNEQLSKLDKLKDEFLANTSHELRTPIVGVLGIAESLLAGAAGTLSEKLRANLVLITVSARRLSNLINDILDFSKSKEHKLEVGLQPIALRSVVDLVLTSSTPFIARKDLVLENAISTPGPAVLADPDRLQQILFNLIGNAIKFTTAGRVTVSATENGELIELSVADTGIGIAKEDEERIFLSFEQVDSSATRRQGGTGLGLAVTKKLVELHGGKIWLVSTPGKGSCFTFSLKKTTAPAAELSLQAETRTPYLSDVPAEAQGSSQEVRIPLAPTARILVVDDEPINRMVLYNQLSLKNFRVVEAESGIQAIEMLERGPLPDLILLDVMMPDLSGYDTCRRIREKHALNSLPIIFVTAKNQISNLVDGFSAGGNDYLAKPFLLNELLARVETQLATSRLDSRLRKTHFATQSALTAAHTLMQTGDPGVLIAHGASAIAHAVSERGDTSVHCGAILRGHVAPSPSTPGLSFVLKPISSLPDKHSDLIKTPHHWIPELRWFAIERPPTEINNQEWTWTDGFLYVPLRAGARTLGLITIQVKIKYLDNDDRHIVSLLQHTISLSLHGMGRLVDSLRSVSWS